MNSKAILGTSLAAIFATMIIVPAMADHSFLDVTDGGVTMTGGAFKATIDATGDIPRATDVLGGYGWFLVDASTWAVFAITTHNAFDSDDPDAVNDVRDSRQNPDSWHAHLVNVDVNACITAVSDIPSAGIAIVDGDMKVTVAKAKMDGSFSGMAAGFHIVPEVPACDGVNPLALQVQFT